ATDWRARSPRARNRNSLLLSAAQVRWKCVAFRTETHLFEQQRCAIMRRTAWHTAHVERQCDVGLGAERRKQIEALKDEPDVVAPNRRQVGFEEGRDVVGHHAERSRRRPKNAAEHL